MKPLLNNDFNKKSFHHKLARASRSLCCYRMNRMLQHWANRCIHLKERPLESKRQQCKCRQRDRACNTNGWEPRAASSGFGRRRGSAHGERASHAVAADAAAMCVPLCCRLGGASLGCGCGRVQLGSNHANNDVSSVYHALPHAKTSPKANTAAGILHL